MKSLEIIFFEACLHEQLIRDKLGLGKCLTFREIVTLFLILGFPYKRLVYYINKWVDKGFYNYGVALDLP